MNPFVFIVGCLRSGTTLLRRMVDAHPELAIIHETQWLPRWFQRQIGVTPDGFVTRELVDRLLEFRRFNELRITRADLEASLAANGPVSYSSFVGAVFDRYGEAQGKSLVGEKSPGYVRYLPTLHSLWPHARFVHLIRDGRDVCLSVLNWRKGYRTAGRFSTWSEDPVATAALWWEWHVRLGREHGRPLGSGLYDELRYESLVADPAARCGDLCRFMGVPYDDAMVRYERGRERRNWGRSAKGEWLPPTPGRRDWRSRMSPDHVERFEAAAGALLTELGYERAFPNPRAEALDAASVVRSSVIDEAGSRGPIPESWQA